MKLMLEGNRKRILKLKKELGRKLKNNGITTKEILPEVDKPVVEAQEKKEVKKTPVTRNKKK